LLAQQCKDAGCAVNGLFVAGFAVSSFLLDPGDLIEHFEVKRKLLVLHEQPKLKGLENLIW
jgi:hypothetical protein